MHATFLSHIFFMSHLTLYSTAACPICEQTKKLLSKWDIPYQEILLGEDKTALREFSEKTNGARMVPQILIDGNWIGGFSELTEMHMDGELDGFMETEKK